MNRSVFGFYKLDLICDERKTELLKQVILIMGICGSGKTTVGKALSKSLGIPFLDADDFHPRSNVMKMSRGEALTDEDRWPWLAAIVEHILHNHRNAFVLGCSALKETYREYLAQRLAVHPVLLEISFEEAKARMDQREGHFMPSSLIQSQLDTLEVPAEAVKLPATANLADQVHLLSESFRKFL